MENFEFGLFVRSLRKQRTFFDKNESLCQWTQAVLAEKSNLSVRQIAKIEQGDVRDLKRYLEPLATAFNLTEPEKFELYTKAGYIYSLKPRTINQNDLEATLQCIPNPACIRTPLRDFLAFNSYHYSLWRYTKESVKTLDEGELGPNLLRVMFDPIFGHKENCGGESKWRENILYSLKVFRSISLPYITTNRYRKILLEMKRFPVFEKWWDIAAEPLSANTTHLPAPIFQVHHPEFGLMEFVSLTRTLHSNLELVVFVPVKANYENYFRFYASVQSKKVTFFTERLLD